MSIASEVFGSTRDRIVRLRKRSDLSVVPQVYRNQPFWLIKDPLEMEFYRLNLEEFAVLEMVDGRRSIEEIKETFEQRFAPQRITHRQLQTFISDLHKKSLLAYVDPDVAPQLIEREKEKRVEKLKKNLSSVLSLKWRGIDPDGFLDAIGPYVYWIFSPAAVSTGFCIMIAAVLWLLAHLDQFTARLPTVSKFLDSENWLLLGSVVIAMKIVHELAHGISFKRFGGECHEIGVMMLMLVIPTLYCSTTDSWMLRNKWHRAAIAAAGMYVELLIAAFATFIWWFSSPGTLNTICLNIMATGTVSVVLLNGNPFFKFDGYYIFSDVMELPNLRERAGKQTQSLFLKYALGIDEDSEPNALTSTKLALVTYKLMAFTVKLIVLLFIKFMLIDKLNPLGLGYVGLTIGFIGFGILLAPPLWSMYKFFEVPGRYYRIEMIKSSATIFATIILAITIFAIPFPHHVKCTFTIEPRNGQVVYVEHPAVLRAVHVKPWETVQPGQLIAELENLEDALRLERLRTEGDEHRAELQHLENTRESSAKTAARISELINLLETNKNSVQELEEIVASFQVVARRSGQVIPEWTGLRPDKEDQLTTFDGSPLHLQNIGSKMPSGQRLCTIGELTDFDAVLVVNEHDIAFVHTGQQATLLLDSVAGQRQTASIESVARKESEHVPGSLSKSNGGSIELQPPVNSKRQSTQPNDEHFEARVPMNSLTPLSVGLRGQARIRVGSATPFERIRMLTYRTFRKKLH